jgi:hypothetical protein
MMIGLLQQCGDPVGTMHAEDGPRGLLDGTASGGDKKRFPAPAAMDRDEAFGDLQWVLGNTYHHGRIGKRFEKMNAQAFPHFSRVGKIAPMPTALNVTNPLELGVTNGADRFAL